MVEVPAEIAVITPVEAFTVATASVPEVQVPPLSPFELKVVDPLAQMSCVPVIEPAFGAVVTVTVAVPVCA